MMSSTNDEDPFLQVQQDVLSQFAQTQSLFKSYLRIRSLATSSTSGASPELTAARADLESSLTSLAEDLADLVESVRAVESDPSRFGLDGAELARRKRLVQEVGGEVDDMREELRRRMDSRAVAAARDAASSDLPHPSAFAIPESGGGRRADDYDEDDGDGEGDNYAEFEYRQQQRMMREQDQHLDGVFQTVGTLRMQAEDMGRELEDQSRMLDVVDEVADRVGGRLQTGMEKLRYVMRHNEDRLSSCCIAILIVVLIILLILLLVL